MNLSSSNEWEGAPRGTVTHTDYPTLPAAATFPLLTISEHETSKRGNGFWYMRAKDGAGQTKYIGWVVSRETHRYAHTLRELELTLKQGDSIT